MFGDGSRVAQWKRAGPITQRSVDRNHALLTFFPTQSFCKAFVNEDYGVERCADTCLLVLFMVMSLIVVVGRGQVVAGQLCHSVAKTAMCN